MSAWMASNDDTVVLWARGGFTGARRVACGGRPGWMGRLGWPETQNEARGYLTSVAYVRDALTGEGKVWHAHFRTTGACGELMIAIAVWIAEQERNRIGERTKAGMQRARREGKHIGRPKKILNRDKIRQMHQQGIGMRAIGKHFLISAMSVSRIVASAQTHPSKLPQFATAWTRSGAARTQLVERHRGANCSVRIYDGDLVKGSPGSGANISNYHFMSARSIKIRRARENGYSGRACVLWLTYTSCRICYKTFVDQPRLGLYSSWRRVP